MSIRFISTVEGIDLNEYTIRGLRRDFSCPYCGCDNTYGEALLTYDDDDRLVLWIEMTCVPCGVPFWYDYYATIKGKRIELEEIDDFEDEDFED